MSSEASALPKAIVEYSTAFLVWIFTLFVFIPLARGVSTEPPLYSLISLIGLAAVVAATYRATCSCLKARKWLSALAERKKGRRYALILEFALTELVIIADSVLLVPLLWSMAPSMGGIALILAVIAFVVTIAVYSEPLAEALIERIMG